MQGPRCKVGAVHGEEHLGVFGEELGAGAAGRWAPLTGAGGPSLPACVSWGSGLPGCQATPHSFALTSTPHQASTAAG